MPSGPSTGGGDRSRRAFCSISPRSAGKLLRERIEQGPKSPARSVRAAGEVLRDQKPAEIAPFLLESSPGWRSRGGVAGRSGVAGRNYLLLVLGLHLECRFRRSIDRIFMSRNKEKLSCNSCPEGKNCRALDALLLIRSKESCSEAQARGSRWSQARLCSSLDGDYSRYERRTPRFSEAYAPFGCEAAASSHCTDIVPDEVSAFWNLHGQLGVARFELWQRSLARASELPNLRGRFPTRRLRALASLEFDKVTSRPSGASAGLRSGRVDARNESFALVKLSGPW